MNFFNMSKILTILFLMVASVSCLDDNDPTPPLYRAYAFVTEVNEEYFFNLDNGSVLKAMEFDDTDLELENNDRVMISFYIEDSFEDLPYNHLIKLHSLHEVSYSNIVELNSESRDTIGDGKVYVSYVNVTGYNLNVEYEYLKGEEEHQFSLCYDEEEQKEGEPPVLELRNYYPGENSGKIRYAAISSFNVSDLADWGKLNNENQIEFVLKYNTDDHLVDQVKLYYTPD